MDHRKAIIGQRGKLLCQLSELSINAPDSSFNESSTVVGTDDSESSITLELCKSGNHSSEDVSNKVDSIRQELGDLPQMA
ncbi:unnamed protein product [Protopolystoma xenopodis]|uniref:K Homology domain-containing protein n=1 Tax=Protopolystoma xenopodis TaxID=117903 RepID=A0A448XNM5_9PLAT|nr:unnamed protein product [Protopolystoma xenopodis]